MASRATAYRAMASVERRDTTRTDVQIVRAAMQGIAQEAVAATLVEISIYGCRIACDSDVAGEESIRLSLRGSLPIAAKVVWNRDGMIGCRFDAPIGRPLLRSLTIES